MRFLLALALVACGSSTTIDASIDAGTDAANEIDAGPPELAANASAPRYAIVNEEIALDGSASTGATQYQWAYGDGREGAASAEPIARVSYPQPGRYRAVLTVSDARGRRRMASVLITVTFPLTHTPVQSGSIAIDRDRGELAIVSPDSDELVLFRLSSDVQFYRRVATARDPRTVTRWRTYWVVVAQEGNAVQFFDDDPTVVHTIAMPYGSHPFGAIGLESEVLVTLQGRGAVASVDTTGVRSVRDAIEDARGIALLPDGRVAITRWRSPDDSARVGVLGGEEWSLGYDPQPGSDTESGGVPSYLDQLLVSPTGRVAIVPSLQAAIGEGLYRSPRALTFQTTLRAAISYLDPITGVEDFARRKLFDNRGFASAGAFTSHGDYLYVAMRGERSIERIDVLTGAQAGSVLDAGYAIAGVALSPDDRLLFVDAYLSRELVVYDVLSASLPVEVGRFDLVASEPLDPVILQGKILFNDSFDPRLDRDSYLACAHCHLDGVGDRRTWDFTDRGEGLRNTIDLVGRAGLGHGALHWSANFDEVQDFENDIRNAFRGTGLMSDADYHTGTRSMPLGDPKAGVSADLDALAAYVSSLDRFPESPHRNSDGTPSDAAMRGQTVFTTSGCDTCHRGPALTDSTIPPVLHDVGTLGPGSGMRLGAPLTGIDTPTLHGVWMSAPYLHDGSAPTLRDVIARNTGDRHGTTSTLSAEQIDDLIAYLLSLE